MKGIVLLFTGILASAFFLGCEQHYNFTKTEVLNCKVLKITQIYAGIDGDLSGGGGMVFPFAIGSIKGKLKGRVPWGTQVSLEANTKAGTVYFDTVLQNAEIIGETQRCPKEYPEDSSNHTQRTLQILGSSLADEDIQTYVEDSVIASVKGDLDDLDETPCWEFPVLRAKYQVDKWEEQPKEEKHLESAKDYVRKAKEHFGVPPPENPLNLSFLSAVM